jgi:hypothetical protein
MILGFVITGPMIVVFGLVLLLLIFFEVAVGLRWIKLGRNRLKIHKWVGVGVLGLAVLHGLAGASFALGWRIL